MSADTLFEVITSPYLQKSQTREPASILETTPDAVVFVSNQGVRVNRENLVQERRISAAKDNRLRVGLRPCDHVRVTRKQRHDVDVFVAVAVVGLIDVDDVVKDLTANAFERQSARIDGLYQVINRVGGHVADCELANVFATSKTGA